MKNILNIFNSFEKIAAITAVSTSFIAFSIIFNKSNINTDLLGVLFGLAGSLSGILIVYIIKPFITSKPDKDVYIAYSYQDKDIAKKLSVSLSSNKIRVFSENDLNLGDDIEDEYKKIIDEVEYVIILVSKDFQKSKSLKKIIDISKERQKKIIPILVEDTDIPKSLANFKYFDTSKNFDYAENDLVGQLIGTH